MADSKLGIILHGATGMLGTLDRAVRTAPETAQFNGHARELARGLLDAPPTSDTARIRSLADRIGVR